MQIAPAGPELSGPESSTVSARTVGAKQLLDDSERLWAADLHRALHCDGTPGSRHRRALALEALAAYVRLAESAGAAPAVAFRRWPACTTVALAAIAAAAGTKVAFEAELRRRALDGSAWVTGWAECWAQLTADHPGPSPVTAPGVPLLLALSTGPATVLPEVRLHLDTGALVVVFPDSPGRGVRVEAGGGDCPAVGGRWLVPRPAPRVTCHDVLGDVHLLPVVDVRDPLLVFDEDGRLIPAGAPLPAGAVWIVHLGEPADEAFDGERRITEVAPPPVGWTRWWLGRVDLSATTAIRSAVRSANAVRLGAWRPVANAERADLEFEAPVLGLFDADGDVVYATAPRLRLPGRPDETWSIEVRRDDAAVPHRRSAPGGEVVALADGLRRPVAGRFTVHAHAAGHRPLRGSFTLVEGLRVRAKPEIRLFAEDGLMPGSVTLAAPAGLHVPRVVRLGPGVTERDVELGVAGSDRRLRLRLRLPHCALRSRVAGEAGTWVLTPPTFTLDDLEADAALDVRLPERIVEVLGTVPALVVAATPDDQAARRITARRVSAGVYRYPLAGLADQVRLHGSTPLWLETMRARVGTVSHVLASGAEVEGAQLRLVDRARHQKVRVTVCAPRAPWVPPQVTELAEDEDGLPLDPSLAGRSLLAVVAPVEVEPQRWPDPRRLQPPAVALRVSGTTAVGSPVEQAMSRYLAGIAPLPAVPIALPLLWAVAARAHLALGDGLGRLTAQECAAHLAATPVASLLAAGDSGLDDAELVEPLIRSGLAAHGIRTVPSPAAVLRLWDRAPLIALVLTSPLLPHLAGTPRWDPAELDGIDRDVLAAARTHSPADALTLLADPTSVAGWAAQACDAAPGPDGSVDDALADLRSCAAASPAAALFSGVDQRTANGMPAGALSFGCALVARLAAQGEQAAAALEPQLRPLWIEIARHAPARATHDLMAAEFAVSGWFARHS